MMRWLAMALMLVAAGASPAAADTTTKFALSNSGWTDLGPGPLLLSFTGIGGVFAISDTTPSFKNEGFGKARGGSIKIPTPSHVWATTKDVYGVMAYVAPITGGGGGAVVSSVWSASDAAATGMTLSNGGLTVVASSGTYDTIRGTTSHNSGKLYVEFSTSVLANTGAAFGIADAGFVSTSYLSASPVSMGAFNNGTSGGTTGLSFNYNLPNANINANDVMAIAADLTAGKFWLAINNVWYGSGVPATGVNPMATIVAPALGVSYFPAMSLLGSGAGTWTFKPTAASQKYAPPAGFTAWDSGGATGCSQATAYLARATGETAHAADLTTLICGLVSDGVWAKLDALYVFAQQTQADANLNLIGTSYPITVSGIPTFTQYRGYNGFSSAYYLDTGFNAATAVSPNFTQNSANLGAWVNVYAASNAAIIGNGAVGASGESHIFPNNSGGFYARVNNSGVNGVTPPVAQIGLYVGDRSGAASTSTYFNGSSLGTDTTNASQAPFNGNFKIGFVSTAGSLDQIAEAHIGASLGSAGNLALYTRLRTYATAVGLSLLRENLPSAKPNPVKP
jgi:hypothetical protein